MITERKSGSPPNPFTHYLTTAHEDLGLGIKDANKVQLLRELNEYLITQRNQSHIVSVLVDEAQI